jgi:hypothetical protein
MPHYLQCTILLIFTTLTVVEPLTQSKLEYFHYPSKYIEFINSQFLFSPNSHPKKLHIHSGSLQIFLFCLCCKIQSCNVAVVTDNTYHNVFKIYHVVAWISTLSLVITGKYFIEWLYHILVTHI